MGEKNRIIKNIDIQIRPWSGVYFNYVIGQVKHSGQGQVEMRTTAS